MQTINQALTELFLKRHITLDDAMARSSDIDELKSLIAAGGSAAAGGGSSPGVRR